GSRAGPPKEVGCVTIPNLRKRPCSLPVRPSRQTAYFTGIRLTPRRSPVLACIPFRTGSSPPAGDVESVFFRPGGLRSNTTGRTHNTMATAASARRAQRRGRLAGGGRPGGGGKGLGRAGSAGGTCGGKGVAARGGAVLAAMGGRYAGGVHCSGG